MEPQRQETQGQVEHLKLVCHPELRNGTGAWGFKGESGSNSQDKDKSSLIDIISFKGFQKNTQANFFF